MDYTYIAYTEDKRIVKGKVSASTEKVAADILDKIGYRVISLKPLISFLPSLDKYFPSRIKASEMVTFSRQLALLIESGVGIVQSLELLGKHSTSRRLQKVLSGVVTELRRGSSLSAALAKYPQIFSPVYCKMIGVGEQTGGLETVLRSLADYAEREAAAINKLKTALTYPAIVFSIAIVVVVVLIVVAFPPLVGLFTAFGTELPLFTKVLFFIVNSLTHYGLYLFLGIGALAVMVFLYTRSPVGRYHWDKLLLSLPAIGRLSLVTELARCCRSLALLFRAGLPLPEIMALTRKASGNQVIARALGRVEQEVLRGEGLSRPMSKNSLFLPLMVEMTRVGEETGNLDGPLITVAQNYEVEAEDKLRTLLGLIEPVMTVLLGLVVAFIALSIFMPLYEVLGSFK